MSEVGWLIEANGTYWNGHGVDRDSFTPKHQDAVRFARCQDAEAVKYWLLREFAFALRSVEHVWMDSKCTHSPEALSPGWVHDGDAALNPQTGERIPYDAR